MMRQVQLFLAITCLFVSSRAFAADEKKSPRSLDKRLKIELFAEHPQIVTPTGIDVDHRGRVWAIESNTHFPPDGYPGHPSDRVLVMENTAGDHKADKITVFTDGLKHTMSIAVRPVWLNQPAAQARVPSKKPVARAPGWLDVFIATRRAIWLFSDDDGDLKADRKQRIIRLDTKGDYPHNGLAGFAFDALGRMYFGFGENLGADYKLIGSDGTILSGGGEGGNIYRCRPDGSKLSKWATGFWNPHASCVDAFGRLFTVDNDPDSRPPCRLLHIIEGGDYGFHFRNGRKGLHPFTSWNGEIPGTLPMVAGTGEAPSGIVAYESDGLPKDYIGNLLVGSWGDHRIDRFRLKPRGASFESLAETFIQGGENFRPVGLAVAPDGSLYCTDWVRRDYKLHGHGRVWRISMVDEPKRKVIDVATITEKTPIAELQELLKSKRLDLRRMAGSALMQSKVGAMHLIRVSVDYDFPRRTRIEAHWALERLPIPVLDFDLLRLKSRRFRRKFSPDRDFTNFFHDKLEKFVFFLNQNDPDTKLSDLFTEEFEIKPDISDPFVFSTFVREASANCTDSFLAKLVDDKNVRESRFRIAFLLAARKRQLKKIGVVSATLNDRHSAVRRAAVQWVAEENLKELRPQVEAILNDTGKPMTTDLFLATLAALEMLDGKSPQDFDKTPSSKYVLPLVKDAKRSPTVRAQALRLVDPADPALDAELMQSLLDSGNRQLQMEAVRTLQQVTGQKAEELLRTIAADADEDRQIRAEAVVGLGSRKVLSIPNRELLLSLLNGDDRVLRSEALRSLRGFVETDAEVKRAIESLSKTEAGSRGTLAEEIALARGQKPGFSKKPGFFDAGGDADAGRRVFFHTQSAGCYKCHTVNGRGGKVGPDLSRIGGALSRKRLAESILEPSKEIAPQFTNWTFVMKSGKVHTGMLLGDTRDELQRIGTASGEVIALKAAEIEERHPQQKSLMPDDLVKSLTVGEFRDLLAYMQTLK